MLNYHNPKRDFFSALPQGRGRKPLLLVARNRYALRLADQSGLRHILRDGTALLKVDRIIEVLVLWLFADNLQISCFFLIRIVIIRYGKAIVLFIGKAYFDRFLVKGYLESWVEPVSDIFIPQFLF